MSTSSCSSTNKLTKIFTTVTEVGRDRYGGPAFIDITFPTSRGAREAASTSSSSASKNTDGTSSTSLTDSAIDTSPDLAFIRFRNHYTYSITVRQLMSPIDGPASSACYSTLVADYQLMKSSHHEDDAQAWHVLHVKDFRKGSFFPDKLVRLRFVLHQPSPMWNTFSLQSIDCFEDLGGVIDKPAGTRAEALPPDSFVRPLESGFFHSKTMYMPPYEQLHIGTFGNPGSALSSMNGRVLDLKETLQKLRSCKKSKVGNPSSALDFSNGSATAVRIAHFT